MGRRGDAVPRAPGGAESSQAFGPLDNQSAHSGENSILSDPDQGQTEQNCCQVAPAHIFENYKHSSQEAHRTAEQFKWRQEGTLSKWIAIFTGVIVVFTGLAFWETKRQADYAAKSVPRAWLYVELEKTRTNDLWARDGLVVPVKVHNYGSTPGTILKMTCQFVRKTTVHDGCETVDFAAKGVNVPVGSDWPNVGPFQPEQKWKMRENPDAFGGVYVRFTLDYVSPYETNGQTGFEILIDSSMGAMPTVNRAYNYQH